MLVRKGKLIQFELQKQPTQLQEGGEVKDSALKLLSVDPLHCLSSSQKVRFSFSFFFF